MGVDRSNGIGIFWGWEFDETNDGIPLKIYRIYFGWGFGKVCFWKRVESVL